MPHILAIDQGTTSSRAILFDASMQVVATAQKEFPQIFPTSGWVEHDPADLWSSVAGTARAVIEKAGVDATAIAAIGITNQRETTLIWDRETGQPIHNAIVWQDRRTAPLCQQMKEAGLEPMITHRTGLLLDPYFSGTKVKWLLDNVDADDRALLSGEEEAVERRERARMARPVRSCRRLRRRLRSAIARSFRVAERRHPRLAAECIATTAASAAVAAVVGRAAVLAAHVRPHRAD